MEERILILQMLSEGKISVEEAEKLLAAIGAKESADKNEKTAGIDSKQLEEKMKEFGDKAGQMAGVLGDKLGKAANVLGEKITKTGEKINEKAAERATERAAERGAEKVHEETVNYPGGKPNASNGSTEPNVGGPGAAPNFGGPNFQAEQIKSELGSRIEGISNDIAGAATKFADRMIQFVGGIYEKASDRYKYTNTFTLTPENLRKFYFSANTCGVIVKKAEGPEIKMKLDVSSFMEISNFDGIVETSQDGESFFVKIKFPPNCWGVAEIEIPENMEEAELKSSNGKIEISNYKAGILRAITSNAKLEFTDVTAAEIEALTDNAKITFENVKADYCVLRSSNGKIEMDCCEIININGKTSNGAIKIPCAILANNGNYDYQLETSNGGISINFNEVLTHGFTIDLATSNGKVVVDLDALKFNSTKAGIGGFAPVLLKSENYESSTAKINIKAKSSNGPITIEEE